MLFIVSVITSSLCWNIMNSIFCSCEKIVLEDIRINLARFNIFLILSLFACLHSNNIPSCFNFIL